MASIRRSDWLLTRVKLPRIFVGKICSRQSVRVAVKSKLERSKKAKKNGVSYERNGTNPVDGHQVLHRHETFHLLLAVPEQAPLSGLAGFSLTGHPVFRVVLEL